MSKIKFFIIQHFFLLILSLVNTQNIEPIKIQIDSFKDSIELNSDNSFDEYFLIEYKEEDLNNKNYLTIYTYNSIYDKNAFIYVSFTEQNPSPEKRDYVEIKTDAAEEKVEEAVDEAKEKIGDAVTTAADKLEDILKAAEAETEEISKEIDNIEID